MRRITIALLLVVLLAAVLVTPALAVVDPVSPIDCPGTSVPAEGASGGNAGGSPTGGANSSGSPVGPPFPSEGGDNAAECP